MAIKGNASQWVANWQAGVQAKQGNYKTGVQNGADWVAATTSPEAIAARNAGLQRAMNDGTIEAGVARLTTGTYKTITASKAQNWVTGVTSQQSVNNANLGFQKLYGFLQNADAAIAGMPRGGFAANMQRMNAFVTSVHNQSQQAKGYPG